MGLAKTFFFGSLDSQGFQNYRNAPPPRRAQTPNWHPKWGSPKRFFLGPLILKDFKTTATLRRRDAPSTPNWHPKGFLPKRFFLGPLILKDFMTSSPSFAQSTHPHSLSVGFLASAETFPSLARPPPFFCHICYNLDTRTTKTAQLSAQLRARQRTAPLQF